MGKWAICIFLPIGNILNLKQNQESTEIKVKEADEYGVKALGMEEWAICIFLPIGKILNLKQNQ